MSLTDIEQNDVDISRLFSYKKEIVMITPDDKEITLYLKVLGDADNNIAKTNALRESGKFREQLRDREWKDRSLYVPEMLGKTKEEIVDIVIALEISRITMDAVNDVQVQYPKELDGDASLEDQEKYQEEVDGFSEKYEKAITKEVDKRTKAKRIEVNKLKKDDIVTKYENSLINQGVQTRYYDEYMEWALYFATYEDENYSVRAFKDVDSFRNSPAHLKEALIEEYSSIEIGASKLKK